ncbi:MAG TPA: hypothetical protein PK264_13865 [Hyphomicrobiaceae bacterium]|nr:hypothetical protein [Hyphomicrobiaceae bacterium]
MTELQTVLLFGFANPIAVAMAFWLGRSADQPQKSVIGGFLGGLIAVLLAAAAASVGWIKLLPRSYSGVFVCAFAVGMLAAWLGYRTRRR